MQRLASRYDDGDGIVREVTASYATAFHAFAMSRGTVSGLVTKSKENSGLLCIPQYSFDRVWRNLPKLPSGSQVLRLLVPRHGHLPCAPRLFLKFVL